LASLARRGEILVSEDTYQAAGIDLGDPERRTVELRGRAASLDVRVITVQPVGV
jgi:class 3 adenylate cyclase